MDECDLDWAIESRDFSATISNIVRESARVIESTRSLDFSYCWEQVETERKQGRHVEGLGILVDFEELDVKEFVNPNPGPRVIFIEWVWTSSLGCIGTRERLDAAE